MKNYGRNIEFFSVIIVFYSQDSLPVYADTIGVSLFISESLSLSDYGTRTFSQPGTYVVMKCSTMLHEDQNPANDGGKKRVIVLPDQILKKKPRVRLK